MLDSIMNFIGNLTGNSQAAAELGEYTWIIVGIIAIVVIYKLISVPFKFVINGIIGCVMLLAVNWVGTFVNFSLPVNIITALVAGIFGIPGMIALIIYYGFLH